MNKALENILFIDIETVSCQKSYNELSDRLKSQWDRKAEFIRKDDTQKTEELFDDRAAIYAEFGKVIVIALGFFTYSKNEPMALRVKSFYGHKEKELLTEFKNILETRFSQENTLLCGHNGKEFDFPYLCRRMLVNQIPLPGILDISSKKPWEVNFLDTMEMWKFGDRKNFTSLDLLTAIFDVPSSKSDLDGSMVNKVYYEDDGLTRIAAYCCNDVIATAQLFLRMKCLPLIHPQLIHIV